MNLAAAATKHYGNMTGRYTWAGQVAGSMIRYRLKKTLSLMKTISNVVT